MSPLANGSEYSVWWRKFHTLGNVVIPLHQPGQGSLVSTSLVRMYWKPPSLAPKMTTPSNILTRRDVASGRLIQSRFCAFDVESRCSLFNLLFVPILTNSPRVFSRVEEFWCTRNVNMNSIFRRDDDDDDGTPVAFVNPWVELNAGLWSLFAGATIFLALRIWCKVTRRHGLWYDDYILLVTWVSDLHSVYPQCCHDELYVMQDMALADICLVCAISKQHPHHIRIRHWLHPRELVAKMG